jgi:hypothetical protein
MTVGADSSDQELAQARPEHSVFRLRPDRDRGPATGVAG